MLTWSHGFVKFEDDSSVLFLERAASPQIAQALGVTKPSSSFNDTMLHLYSSLGVP